MKKVLPVFLLVLGFSTAYSQSLADMLQPAPPPSPILEQLLGPWNVDFTVNLGRDGEVLRGDAMFRKDFDDRYYRLEMNTSNEYLSVKSDILLSYLQDHGKYLMYMFDNTTNFPLYSVGSADTEENRIEFETEMVINETPLPAIVRLTVDAGNRFAVNIYLLEVREDTLMQSLDFYR